MNGNFYEKSSSSIKKFLFGERIGNVIKNSFHN